jgi:hypothetical protein
VNANLLGFDSREREKVDALCNAVETQTYNRKGNEPPDNYERDVFGCAHPEDITSWHPHSLESAALQALPLPKYPVNTCNQGQAFTLGSSLAKRAREVKRVRRACRASQTLLGKLEGDSISRDSASTY